jgi:hypothetical protein
MTTGNPRYDEEEIRKHVKSMTNLPGKMCFDGYPEAGYSSPVNRNPA